VDRKFHFSKMTPSNEQASSSKEVVKSKPSVTSLDSSCGASQDTYLHIIELSKFYNESLIEEELQFQERMNTYGRHFNPPFKIIDVPGDGNCFYHAIQQTWYTATGDRQWHEAHDHQRLRQMVADHISLNHEDYEDMFKTLYHSELRDREAIVIKYLMASFDFYIHDQAQIGTYADEIAIKSMARILNMDIIVVSSVNGHNQAIMVFNSQPNKVCRKSVIIVCKPNRHFYATEIIQWENSAEEERITKQQIDRFGSLFQPPFQLLESGKALNLYEAIIKTVEALPTKDHNNFDRTGAVLVRFVDSAVRDFTLEQKYRAGV
jgi:hypothetical protein